VFKRTFLIGSTATILIAAACGGDGKANDIVAMAGAGQTAEGGSEPTSAGGGAYELAAGAPAQVSMAGQESMGASGPTTSDGGTGGDAGARGNSSAGAAGAPDVPGEQLSLVPVDGWIDRDGNAVGIQGAMFAFADPASHPGLSENFKGSNACISGKAAKVNLNCTPIPPAADCFGTYWGAAIGLNLNQAMDPQTKVGGPPMPYDASALIGFAFDVTGSTIPPSLRFSLEAASGEYCNPPTKPLKAGENVFLFSDLITQCFKSSGTKMNAESGKSELIRLAWKVVTNSQADVPFDYCIGNVRALR